jgi:hypothetical protein
LRGRAGGQGAIERVNGTIQDISTRKQAQIDIEQLNGTGKP